MNFLQNMWQGFTSLFSGWGGAGNSGPSGGGGGGWSFSNFFGGLFGGGQSNNGRYQSQHPSAQQSVRFAPTNGYDQRMDPATAYAMNPNNPYSAGNQGWNVLNGAANGVLSKIGGGFWGDLLGGVTGGMMDSAKYRFHVNNGALSMASDPSQMGPIPNMGGQFNMQSGYNNPRIAWAAEHNARRIEERGFAQGVEKGFGGLLQSVSRTGPGGLLGKLFD